MEGCGGSMKDLDARECEDWKNKPVSVFGLLLLFTCVWRDLWKQPSLMGRSPEKQRWRGVSGSPLLSRDSRCWLLELLSFIECKSPYNVLQHVSVGNIIFQTNDSRKSLPSVTASECTLWILQPLTLNLPWKMTSCRKCGACCSRVGFAGWSSPTPVSSVIVQSQEVHSRSVCDLCLQPVRCCV